MMEEKIEKLKKILMNVNTEGLLGIISLNFSTFADEHGNIVKEVPGQLMAHLASPQKQLIYLAGLMMSTDYVGTGDFDESAYDSLAEEVQNITSEYIDGFISGITRLNPIDTEKVKKIFVSMDAFTSYFDTGTLRYPEQTIALIHALYDPFNEELKNTTGLEVDDYILFYEFVKELLEQKIENLGQLSNEYESFFANAEKELRKNGNIKKIYENMLQFSQNYGGKLNDSINSLNKIKKEEIVNHFGNVIGENLIRTFSLERKERDFTFYNQQNPFAQHPLCNVDAESFFVVSPQILLNAIYDNIQSVIENPAAPFADKVKKKKGVIVEDEFLKCITKILGNSGVKYHTAVCEKPGTDEHDILIEYKNSILICEVKASKVREPFFNPEKAYDRIKDNFFSHSGIGYAYEQACKLQRFMCSAEQITLYEEKTKKFHIEGASKKEILPIIFTLNQFGGLGINTSLLITPQAGESYPWVCNLHDFQNLIEIHNYLQKVPDDFMAYIRWRISEHNHIFAGDELDILEQFYTGDISSNVGKPIYIENNMTNCLIDKIYFARQGLQFPEKGIGLLGAEAGVKFEPAGTPDFMETKKLPIRKKKIYPNEPCPCGSGKKFKKCCRGNGKYD